MPNQFIRKTILFLLAIQIILWGILTYEYVIYLHILAFGTLALFLWFFHYIYTYSLEHLSKIFYLPIFTILLYGIFITCELLFDSYLSAPMDYGIYRILFLFSFYLLLYLIYTYEPMPLRRR